MNAILSAWPLFVFTGVVGGLLMLNLTGRTRPPIPPDALNLMECHAMASLVRSGVFYVMGIVAPWPKCYEFSIKVIRDPSIITQDDEDNF